jgi:hypothetical protein
MGDLRIDYSDLTGLVDDGVKQSKKKKERRARARSFPLRAARWSAVVLALATLPFATLIRGGVFAYREWGLGTWPALTLAVGATALLLGGYGWYLTRRLGAGPWVQRFVTRTAMGICMSSSPVRT